MADQKDDSQQEPKKPEAQAPAAAPIHQNEYHFPTHGVTFTAPSLEEARKKLDAHLAKNKK
jgi:hypothetical protein